MINAYGLKAIDIDIEGTPYNTPADQQKTVDALKIIKANNPGITTYITLGSYTTGPDSSLINRAAGGRADGRRLGHHDLRLGQHRPATRAA